LFIALIKPAMKEFDLKKVLIIAAAAFILFVATLLAAAFALLRDGG
jgi:hypothetical protein